MKYTVELKPKAVKDFKKLERPLRKRVMEAMELLSDDLLGDTKRLTNFTPEYRLRVGKYRILFEIENDTKVVVYRIIHRKDAYRS